ncbi:MAG TPA: sugar phosphate isomerase/epimerase family protein [Armatimonadota bacterium]|nr:sugar phosphate isomerase/epimerase family protein [Armatimonadota bacterium]HOS42274.1 sugar phosphate isomerase/epimerase family protein [Armatimonadota bacterium]
MSSLQIGIFADNLKLPLREGIRTAAALGVASFQMFTTHGEVLPDNMAPAARAEFRQFYQDCGLRLSATCADFGHGFVDAERNRALVPMLYQQVELAVDLGADIITTHIGVVPETPDAVWETLRAALNDIGRYAEEHGVRLATETGPESGPVLRALLETLDTGGVMVNFDPANLTMAGYDLDEALDALLPYVVHTHAKDGWRDPGQWREAPLGEGDVDWPHYVARLKAAGYAGAYTIEREAGDDPIGDVARAIAFLRQF